MRYLLPLCTALAVLLNISPALAGVNSLELTVSTTITPSTCTPPCTTKAARQMRLWIWVTSIFRRSLIRVNRAPFHWCSVTASGLPKQATVTLTAKTGCDGASGGGNGFRNALNGSDDAAGVAAEIWAAPLKPVAANSCVAPARRNSLSIWPKPAIPPPSSGPQCPYRAGLGQYDHRFTRWLILDSGPVHYFL